MFRRPAALLIALVLAVSVSASPVEAKVKYVKHTEKYWTWFGPKDWIASSSVYGIMPTSPTGRDVVDLGQSGLICVAAPTWEKSAKRYFKAQRTFMRQHGLTIEKKSKIKKLGGSSGTLRRQIVGARGKVRGAKIRGKWIFLYEYVSENTCTQVSTGMYSNRKTWPKVRKQLDFIRKHLNYFPNGTY